MLWDMFVLFNVLFLVHCMIYLGIYIYIYCYILPNYRFKFIKFIFKICKFLYFSEFIFHFVLVNGIIL